MLLLMHYIIVIGTKKRFGKSQHTNIHQVIKQNE